MAKGGFRPGSGRTKGVKNKATLLKEQVAAEIAARTAMDARREGKPLAKDVLEEFMLLFKSMAARHQPLPRNMPVPAGRDPNPALFKEYAELTVYTAKSLAPFQSPTFKAMAITLPGTGPGSGALPGDNAKPVEGKVIDLNDPNVAARAYLTLIKSAR